MRTRIIFNRGIRIVNSFFIAPNRSPLWCFIIFEWMNEMKTSTNNISTGESLPIRSAFWTTNNCIFKSSQMQFHRQINWYTHTHTNMKSQYNINSGTDELLSNMSKTIHRQIFVVTGDTNQMLICRHHWGINMLTTERLTGRERIEGKKVL